MNHSIQFALKWFCLVLWLKNETNCLLGMILAHELLKNSFFLNFCLVLWLKNETKYVSLHQICNTIAIMLQSKTIEQTVNAFRSDYVFTYRDLGLPPESSANVIRKLNRMADSGVIQRLSKGRFYKPKQTMFGSLKPSQQEVVKDLLEKNGKIIGYLTGVSIFGQLGLTTQISNIIEIGVKGKKNNTRRGMYSIRFVQQANIITKSNIPLLQLLDSIKSIKQIPDSTPDSSYNRIREIIKFLDEKSLDLMIKLAMKYNPMTRAIVGAIIEELYGEERARILRDTLNPITVYKVGLTKKVLSTNNFRIV